MAKIAYVLGAGFSKPAGFPLQTEILPRLAEMMVNPYGHPASEHVPMSDITNVETFFRQAGYLRSDEWISSLSLEDLFTLLDQVISGRSNFCGLGCSQLVGVRDSLIRCLLGMLHERSAMHLSSNNMLYLSLAARLILDRIQIGQPGDPFSIVSLNWDSLVEDSTFQVLRDTGGICGARALADVDYCVYTRPLNDSVHMPSTKQKAAGIFNLKLLKLHGSATWLRCPCSNHIYTGLGSSKSALELYVKEQASPFIEQYKDPREPDRPSMLEPFIITPTFSKVFDLPHIQTTWHNAFVELREADKVIFIGYSLPDADYHFRTLLRRAIRSTTNIQVVLHESDDPGAPCNENHRPKLENRNELERAPDPKAIYPAIRYRQVFGNDRLTFDYRGVEGLIADLAPLNSHEERTLELRRFFTASP